MRGQHWNTILWLRWRLMVNQFQRMSLISRWISWTLFGLGCLIAGTSFFGAFGLSSSLLPAKPPSWLVFLWDGVVLIFLASYIGGVISELQRSEPLSLDKFLHLPVSTTGIFLLNYFSSLFSLTVCIFLPTMLGLAVGMAVRYGWPMLGVLPLVLVFFAMVTAMTHQFRGWIAALMSDKRRRRTLIAIGTAALVLASLLPMFANRSLERVVGGERQSTSSRQQALRDQLERKEITQESFDLAIATIANERQWARQRQLNRLASWGRLANSVLPVGWLPHGIESMLHGQWLTYAACMLGMAGLASFSLLRSYRTTLRIYLGATAKGLRPAPPVSTSPDPTDDLSSQAEVTSRTNWLFKSFPGLNEHQSAVAMATLRGLSRAPEAKLAIFFPIVILAVLAGGSAFGRKWSVPNDFQALTGIGICFFVMMGASQLIQNQFGFDRDGFRYFLLAPLREKDLLIGKNAALFPLALLLSSTALIVMQVVSPMHWSHFIATFFQLGTMYLVASLVGNLMSIFVPLAVKSGSLKPTNLKFSAGLLQILIFFLAPLGMVPAVLPLLLEWVVNLTFGLQWPLYLMGAMGYLVVMVFVYRWVVRWQGDRLHERRHRILDTVTHTGV